MDHKLGLLLENNQQQPNSNLHQNTILDSQITSNTKTPQQNLALITQTPTFKSNEKTDNTISILTQLKHPPPLQSTYKPPNLPMKLQENPSGASLEDEIVAFSSARYLQKPANSQPTSTTLTELPPIAPTHQPKDSSGQIQKMAQSYSSMLREKALKQVSPAAASGAALQYNTKSTAGDAGSSNLNSPFNVQRKSNPLASDTNLTPIATGQVSQEIFGRKKHSYHKVVISSADRTLTESNNNNMLIFGEEDLSGRPGVQAESTLCVVRVPSGAEDQAQVDGHRPVVKRRELKHKKPSHSRQRRKGKSRATHLHFTSVENVQATYGISGSGFKQGRVNQHQTVDNNQNTLHNQNHQEVVSLLQSQHKDAAASQDHWQEESTDIAGMMMMTQTQHSQTRRMSQKAGGHHKKSAGSQHRHHSKDGGKRSGFHAHHAQTSGGSQPRAFNLIITNNGEQQSIVNPSAGGLRYQANQSSVLSNNGRVTNHQAPNHRGALAAHGAQSQQKRVQSTAPRLFTYKPNINEVSKSPFLQPIVNQSQKFIAAGGAVGVNGKAQNQGGQNIVIGQHGKQVMASMLHHQVQHQQAQQQQQLGINLAPSKQQSTGVPNRQNYVSHQTAQQSTLHPSQQNSYNLQQLTAIPAPLPKFLTKKHERQQILMNQQQNQQRLSAGSSGQTGQVSQPLSGQSTAAANTSVLDAFIHSHFLNQQNQLQQQNAAAVSNQSPRQSSFVQAMQGSGSAVSLSGTIAAQQAVNQSQSGRNSNVQGQAPSVKQQPISQIHHEQNVSKEALISHHKQNSNAQLSSKDTPNSTPIVAYLMQINQQQHLHHQTQVQSKRHRTDSLSHGNGGTLQYNNQQQSINRGQTLHHSSSNVLNIPGNQAKVNQPLQAPQKAQQLDQLQSTTQQMQYINPRQPTLMVLGQSPSNQRLATFNTEQKRIQAPTSKDTHQQQQPSQQSYFWQVNNSNQSYQQQHSGHHVHHASQQSQVIDQRLHNAGKQVLMPNQAVSQFAATQPHQIVGISGPPNHMNLNQMGILYSGHQVLNHHHQQFGHEDDYDDGIDDRFDGDDDSCGGDDAPDYIINDEHTSPKAPKPRPLDQTFVPEKGKKYFSVTIGYPAMRRALRARGWIEVKCYKRLHQIAGYTSSPGKNMNIGLESTMNRQFDQNIDLKFVLSAQDANHQNLKKGCLINQNRGEGHLTCKSGLKESLFRSYNHTANWYPMEHCDPKGIGPEAFFPRSHVINSPESLQEFQRDFVLTEAENYLRKFIKKLKDFKEKPAKVQQQRTQTPSGQQGRSPSKNRQTLKKKKSNAQLSSAENSPVKEPGAKLTSALAQNSDIQSSPTKFINSNQYEKETEQQSVNAQPKQCSLQDLGFLKEKLLICCNIVRKRLKSDIDKLDKKKGIRTDRTTVGTILIEERSFLLRSPKNLSQAYLKYIQKEEWYCKAVARFPQFKKDKSLPPAQQQSVMCEKVAQICQDLLVKLKDQYPQTDLNGYNNLWIVKPGGLSRGRKIRLFKDFQKILEYAEVDAQQQISAASGLASSANPSGANTQYYMNHMKPVGEDFSVYTKKTWVIQKYIENPMLIMNRKFDIRIWVVIPSWNPLKIYYYKECYFRFSCNDYDPRVPQNLFSHLTNNSVVKKCIERPDNAKQLNKIPGNMWNLTQFKEFLGGKQYKTTKKGSKAAETLKNNFPEATEQEALRPKTAGEAQSIQSVAEANEPTANVTTTPIPQKKQPTPTNTTDHNDTHTPKPSYKSGNPNSLEPEKPADDTDYLSAGEQVWNEKYLPQVKEIIVQSILSAWDKIEWRKGGVGIYGFDLFPDAEGKLWLLEINKCPTMEYSTAVTRYLVPRFLEDMTELITDKRKGDHPVVAGFERLYNVTKLRDLSEFQQTQKDLHVAGKGIDQFNNQNYLSALHRNKRKANPPGHNGKYQHQY